MPVIDRDSAQHYVWGQGCEGWILTPSSDLLIIQERMPANTGERRHFHSNSRQFFFVLQGRLTMELDGIIYEVPPMAGIEIAPNSPHQARNVSETDLEFLVISSPTTRGDRTDI